MKKVGVVPAGVVVLGVIWWKSLIRTPLGQWTGSVGDAILSFHETAEVTKNSKE